MDARRFLTLMAILCATVAASEAATLDVTGPAGATLYLDGVRVGRLPLAAPVEVAVGEHELELELAGHQSHLETVEVAQEASDVVLDLDLVRLQRWRATAYSAVLAGLGQHYEGKSRRGWLMIGMQIAAASVAAYGEAQFQSHRDDYEVLDRKYAAAVGPQEIAALREERDAVYDDMDSAEKLRNAALASALAVGVWSVVDAWWGFDSVYLEATPESHATVTAPREGVDLALRVGWRRAF